MLQQNNPFCQEIIRKSRGGVRRSEPLEYLDSKIPELPKLQHQQHNSPAKGSFLARCDVPQTERVPVRSSNVNHRIGPFAMAGEGEPVME